MPAIPLLLPYKKYCVRIFLDPMFLLHVGKSHTLPDIFICFHKFCVFFITSVHISISDKISSILMVSMSLAGPMLPSTWIMSSFSKQRTTCTIASTSRILAKNLLPNPSPLKRLAPNLQYPQTQWQQAEFFENDTSQPTHLIFCQEQPLRQRLPNGTKRIVCRLRSCICNRIKQGALAYIWQANNT